MTATGASAALVGPASADVPVSDFDPYAPEVLAEPFPHLAALRERAPVVWLERYGVYAFTRHREVEDALRDWRRFISSAGVGLSDFRKEKPWRPPSLLLEADPPEHTLARAVISRTLTPKVLAGLKSTFEAEAWRLVERVVAQGRIDGMADLAEAFPLKVFPDALGLAPNEREHLLTYGQMAFNAFGPRNALLERSMQDAARVMHWIGERCRREALRPDGVGRLIYQAVDAGEITEQAAQMLVRSFLTAGVDTTVSGLGAALLHLANHPDQWRRLQGRPELARSAFEEAVRYESPVQTFFRTAAEPVEVAGHPIASGSKVLLLLASANRDPGRWVDPDAFDIERRANGHIGFGSGIHGCVGQMIARMEGETLLGALARQVSDIRLAGDVVRRPNNTLRSIAKLPLTLIAA